MRARGRRAGLLAVAGLTLGALVLPGGTASGAGGGGGAAATVGNGITTADLASVGVTPAALAASLVGDGVTVSNVSYTGAAAQAGTIHVVDPAVVSFNDGIILSSGDIANIVGPNSSDGITGDMGGGDDADLNALIADTQTVNPITFDAASLEFDFVPTADTIYFTYTWASDEYLEWVNLFNDVFAFYVNGQNCATTPGGDPVSIDTINDAVNPQLFRDNAFSAPVANPINIEADGLSVEMICTATVQPGVTNHMKLAIADTSDQILDSFVMLKGGSLGTTKPESCNDGVDNDDDLLVDGEDDSCTSTTTPPPPGSTGIGSDNENPPFTGVEGSPIALDASALGWVATADSKTTSWTVEGINGTTGTCEVVPSTRQPVGPGGAVAVVHAICPNEGEYVARVDGWDVEGGSDWDTDVDFFVQNAPPAVSIDVPSTGDEVGVGETVDLSATVVDPGPFDTVTCAISWGDGTSEPGDLADGTCTGSHAYDGAGVALVSVTATDDAGDSAADAALITVGGTTPVVPTVVPGSATVGEGDEATTTVDVPVALSEPTTVPVTATWHTLEAPNGGTTQAQADVDYVATSGTVTFAPGETEATVALEVIGDVTDEPNEFVLVAFDAPTNAELGGFYGLGVATIADDDPVPTVLPGAGSVVEGNAGTRSLKVPVGLSNPSSKVVKATWTTIVVQGLGGSATPGSDYVAATGTVTFQPGETAKTISIKVAGDKAVEGDELVVVSFTSPKNATIGGFFVLGFGTIVDDD